MLFCFVCVSSAGVDKNKLMNVDNIDMVTRGQEQSNQRIGRFGWLSGMYSLAMSKLFMKQGSEIPTAEIENVTTMAREVEFDDDEDEFDLHVQSRLIDPSLQIDTSSERSAPAVTPDSTTTKPKTKDFISFPAAGNENNIQPKFSSLTVIDHENKPDAPVKSTASRPLILLRGNENSGLVIQPADGGNVPDDDVALFAKEEVSLPSKNDGNDSTATESFAHNHGAYENNYIRTGVSASMNGN